MNSDQHALTGSADAHQTTLARQVSIFLFDLKNEACEHGFKTGESWFLRLATDDEIVRLKKEHYPLVSMRLYPDALLNAFRQVKQRLQQSLNKEEMLLTVMDLTRDSISSLAAYPLKQQDR
ncbi:MAG TPA: hypothetical protein VG367_15055 [Mucilaginibacter sp.]|jgi:hypothetical protein|nr:hypothetical protein [Mucilaginibacter sp.]